MKRWMIFLCATLLLVCIAVAAHASTWYVYTENGLTLNLRSPEDNSVIGHIPYGTKLEADDGLSTELAAYVSYGGKSGYVKWAFLVKDPPPAKSKSSGKTAAQPKATPAPKDNLPAAGEGAVTIRAVGCAIRYAEDKNGTEYSAISYETPCKLVIDAGSRPEYWVIDGVRYDFEYYVPASFTLDEAAHSMTVEAVFGGDSETLLSAEAIQAARTGEQLLVKTIRAKMCHLTAKDYGKGGWMTEFDFTSDYRNKATEKQEKGGQVTVRVRAAIPDGKKISYWKFDEAKLDFDTDVTQFIVRTLNVSKVYEPVFGAAKTTTNKTEYYNVTCKGCTFSGGGYTNATSGKVPAGTQITVTNKTGSGLVQRWEINGTTLLATVGMPGVGREKVIVTNNTITRTINKDTTIQCWGVIN